MLERSAQVSPYGTLGFRLARLYHAVGRRPPTCGIHKLAAYRGFGDTLCANEDNAFHADGNHRARARQFFNSTSMRN